MESRRVKRIALHIARAVVFAGILTLLHWQHVKHARQGNLDATLTLDHVRPFFMAADNLSETTTPRGQREVFDVDGKTMGFVVTTSPDADHLIGFSGPTNVLVAFDAEGRIVGFDVLHSADTRDHVATVLNDEMFTSALNGLRWEDVSQASQLDAVSGATLTSRVIQESIILRLSGARPSLRFPNEITLVDAQTLFKSACSLAESSENSTIVDVFDGDQKRLGAILRTAPFADNVIGYQGPTETRIGIGLDGKVIGIALGATYDNEKYVTYVREDDYFRQLFNGLDLSKLAQLNLFEAQVEGVSGATMTSMAVAESLLVAADRSIQQQSQSVGATSGDEFEVDGHVIGTTSVIFAALLISFTKLRRSRRLNIVFQLILVAYLGLTNGDTISQAMIVGWAQNGVPWRSATGLFALSIAAFTVPLISRRNVYCSHLCPHGAAQQLLRRPLPWQWRVPRRVGKLLSSIPGLLLVWCVVVAMMALPFSLVDIEPFDAWIVSVAGAATMTIAIAGLAASLFVPMAYCRYGCPTGALLGYLRFNSRSDEVSLRDLMAVGMFLIAAGIYLAT